MVVRESVTCTISFVRRCRERCRNSLESSNPMAVRRSFNEARIVVPLPENGSRIVSPSLVVAWRMRSSSAMGFCVGCLPKRFSHFSGGLIGQTDFICLPPFSLFMSL